MKKIIYTVSSLLFFVLISCGGGSDGDGDVTPVDPNPDPVVIIKPKASELIYPTDNSICEAGEFINDTQSNITIRWNKSDLTTSYKLLIINQNNNDKQEIDGIENGSDDVVGKLVTLEQNTPYSWYVISERGVQTAQSETWQFYNASQGVRNYAPFPADLKVPANEETVTVLNPTIEWVGVDADDDIASFEILVDTVNPPVQSIGEEAKNVSSKELSGLIAGTTYYWQVITKDDFGNITKSKIKEFTTP